MWPIKVLTNADRSNFNNRICFYYFIFFVFCLGAHRKKAHEIVAIAGTLDPSLASEASSRQVSEGAEVLLAPGYVDGTRLDLALIRLKRPFKWRNDLVLPVCLPLLTANDPRFSQRGGGVRVNKTLDSTKTGEKKKIGLLLPPTISFRSFHLFCISISPYTAHPHGFHFDFNPVILLEKQQKVTGNGFSSYVYADNEMEKALLTKLCFFFIT